MKNIAITPKEKRDIIYRYQREYQYNVFIETGTFLGFMVYAMLDKFKTIYSVELGLKHFIKAKVKFASHSHVKILQGDSGKVIPKILKNVCEPAIFWLDAHYSGKYTARGDLQCPIYAELDAIVGSLYHHVILIDDARSFNGTNDFPTIPELKEHMLSLWPGCDINVKNDMIICKI